MSKFAMPVHVDTETEQIARATVISVRENMFVVSISLSGDTFSCYLMHTGGAPLSLIEGEEVLVIRPTNRNQKGVILGTVSRGDRPEGETARESPDELVIDAKKNLTLKCGEGSITIREDGKILIKGKDLVSHAQRMNRIKGGSVSIN